MMDYFMIGPGFFALLTFEKLYFPGMCIKMGLTEKNKFVFFLHALPNHVSIKQAFLFLYR